LKVEQGEKVVGTAQMQGTEMMVVSDLSIMNAWIEISENDIALVSYGDTAEVTIDAFPDRVFKGVVYEIGNSALTSGTGTQDETTNFQVKVRLVDTDFKLKPGMSCSVDIITETKKDIIAVPLRAITVRLGNETGSRGQRPQGEQGNASKSDDAPKSSPNKKPPTIIFLYENGVVKQKKIKTGISDKGFIEVTEGLNEGQTFVSGSYQMVSKVLQEGMKVTVEKEGAGKKRSGGKPQ